MMVKELRRKGVTLQLLWEEYLRAHLQFCYHFHFWRKSAEVSMHIDHKAGETTPATGWRFRGAASELTYVEASATQQGEDCRSNERALATAAAAPRHRRRGQSHVLDAFAQHLHARPAAESRAPHVRDRTPMSSTEVGAAQRAALSAKGGSMVRRRQTKPSTTRVARRPAPLQRALATAHPRSAHQGEAAVRRRTVSNTTTCASPSCPPGCTPATCRAGGTSRPRWRANVDRRCAPRRGSVPRHPDGCARLLDLTAFSMLGRSR